MKYIIVYIDSKNILQRYTQSGYETKEEAQKDIDYYLALKYEDSKFIRVMETTLYFKLKNV